MNLAVASWTAAASPTRRRFAFGRWLGKGRLWPSESAVASDLPAQSKMSRIDEQFFWREGVGGGAGRRGAGGRRPNTYLACPRYLELLSGATLQAAGKPPNRQGEKPPLPRATWSRRADIP